ncbi:immunogenic protein [Thioalkalivibrio denitrificans]|uniref:Immunogenic protein n=1 Tax=Thioalkalivibrio denitrificans TaxID=108003 RepID=A0A1V3NU43_9GAMM|nr:TAXI family TRAP transporter solute-binding subunit [Thioalkalivibrio denitrificans]OOG28637.1 immunogenic protein [Thioalkalivibrio denitrificans]
MSSLKSRFLSTFIALGATFALTVATIAPAEAQRQTIRIATSSTGSYGYAVGTVLSETIQRGLGRGFEVVVQPYPSTSGAMISVMNGEGEFGYTADVGMRSLYDGARPYDDFSPRRGMLVHSLYVYPMETFMLVLDARKDEFNSYADFDGRPVFFTPAGFMNWLNMRRIFAALGYEFNHVEIDSATVADAYQARSIDGSAGYTTAGRSLPTYWREAELRANLAAINPTEEEKEKLRAAGLVPVEIDPSVAFSQELGVDRIWGVPIYFAYNVRADFDADLMKRILEILHENVERLVDGDPGFGPLAADFVGTQAAGVAANPDIPVHPGLAAFLKDHGQWDDSWTIAGQ